MTDQYSSETNTFIAILVLNFNGKSHIHSFMASAAFLEREKNVTLIFIDNASYDESVSILKKMYPWVTVIQNKNNHGWGKGYNDGIDKIPVDLKFKITHYLFLNNDVTISPDWFRKLESFATNASKNIGEIGCRTLFQSPCVEEKLFCAKGSSYALRQFNVQFLSKGKWTEIQQIQNSPFKSTFSIKAEPTTFKDASILNHNNGQGYILWLQNNGKRDKVSLTLSPGTLCSTSPKNLVVTITDTTLPEVKKKPKITLQPGQKILLIRLISPKKIRHQIQNSGLAINKKFQGYDLHLNEDFNIPQNTRKLAGVCGVCKLVSKEAFHAAAGFDPNYFMYYEDLDFSMRLRKMGYEGRIIDDAYLMHDHCGSSSEFSNFFNRQVSWSLYYFHYKHGSLLRRLITFFRYHSSAFFEKFEAHHEFSKYNRLAIKKFKQMSPNRCYLLGPRRKPM